MNYRLREDSEGHASDAGLLHASAIESATDAVNSINHLLTQGQNKHALSIADKAVRKWPDHVPLLILSGQLASNIGRLVAAKQLLTRAARMGSSQAAQIIQSIIDEAAPYWHFRMMNDELRNDAYNRALQEYVGPESLVLDIGSGAGLLSMMAARAKAKHVFTCDVSELLLATASSIFDLNGYGEKITAFHSISNNLKVGQHLPRKVDIIVAEVFDSGLLGEKALSTFAHARKHLLAPGGRILPGKASVQAQLIESPLMRNEVKTYQCSGFDVTPMNELTPSYFQERLNTHEHRVLSSIKTVLDFNFETDEPVKHKRYSIFECTADGICHGVAFWFTLDFGKGITLSTGPENTWNCWKQAICIFDKPVQFRRGQSLRVQVNQSLHRITFSDAKLLEG